MMNKCAMEKEIARVSFTMDELRLFLDTHTCDKEALSAFRELRKRRERLLESYEAQFGPMEAYRAGGTDKWNWVSQPWPWEKGC
ncbi:MAG: spore coat protein CotJB [Oscillospiraceae bacterium]|nr:spore coat protein CotJB [Oscillospiraceae bacterium]